MRMQLPNLPVTKRRKMKKQVTRFIINLALLIAGTLTVYTGLLLQVKYHMGNHGFIDMNNHVYGISYTGWSCIHKISIVVLSLFMILHFILHWKWYTTVIKKGLWTKNQQVLGLTFIFILVATTGFAPWFIDLTKGDDSLRKAFIEIHDKLALILAVYLILHITKRIKWFFNTFEKIINKNTTKHFL